MDEELTVKNAHNHVVIDEHDLVLRPLESSDLEQLVALFRREYGNHQLVTIENFHWQLFDNLIQPQVAWVAWHRSDGQPVAYYQLLTQRFIHRGETFQAAYSLNTLVDECYRKCFWRDQKTKKFVSLFPALAYLAYEQARSQGMSFITALPNEKSKRGFFDSLGFKKLSSLDLMVHPGRPGEILSRRLNDRLLGKLSAPVANFSARLVFHAFSFTGRYQVKPLGLEHLQTMAKLAQNHQQDEIVQPRTADYLRWRYFDCPREYKLLGLFDKDEALLSWLALITLRKGSDETGYYPVGIITDTGYQQNKLGMSHAKKLVSRVCRDLTEDLGLVMILALRNPTMRSRSPLSRRLFFTMPSKLSGRELNFGLKPLSDDVPESMLTGEKWQLTFSDFDVA